uniref:Uncharacterized protein n=1 Tax=Anopheles albimanus TaxID=7167 RepID=A0A182F4F0_ANOAL
MCVVGGIGVGGEAAGMPSSDSDINYDDGDSGEWQTSSSSSSSSSSVEGGDRSKELPPSSPWSLGGLPVPSNLIRWNDPPSAEPRSHHVRSRMHHVRHEQHYLQGHYRASKPNKWHSVSEVDGIRGDGPTVIHDENHQKGRHGHHNHHNKHHNHHRTAGTASTESSEEASVTRHDHRHRQQLTDFGVPKDVSHGLSQSDNSLAALLDDDDDDDVAEQHVSPARPSGASVERSCHRKYRTKKASHCTVHSN